MGRESKPKNLTNFDPLDFFRERGGCVIQSEYGWLNYYVMPNDIVYLENFYINPHYRRSQKGTYLLSIFEIEAKELRSAKTVLTTISRDFGNPDRTLEICLKRGFKFTGSTQSAIYLSKEL